MERSTAPAYPSLLYFFNTSNVTGINSSQVGFDICVCMFCFISVCACFVLYLCVHVLFYICVGTDFVDWTWERVYTMKRDVKCALLMTDCDRIIRSFGVRPVFQATKQYLN